MKLLLNTFIALTMALCAALTQAADADPPAVAGRLNYLSGPVSFAPAEANEDWSAAALNRPITTGDRLWTDTDGRAEIHVGSLAIRMGAQTSLDVLALDDRTLQLRLAQGNANLRVRRLASDKQLEIATPSGAVVVRQPGSYRINVDPSGAATIVAVRGGGQAEVFTGNSSFIVHDNQQATVSGNRQDLFAAQPVDEFDRWAATRDQREDRVVSTRYVPEEMTGYEDLDQYGAWRTASEYGPVWIPTSVPTGWAPYRAGHWVWVSPWGWTWVDNAPWGFAPFHYGRWIYLNNHWAWAPGRRVARPVYAPALVAFIGGSNWSISVGSGPAVGWVPLGWREPYRPWYRTSPAYVRNVNVTHVTNVTNINNVTNVRLVNRNAPSAVTVVSRENFVGARRADQAALRVDARALRAARVTQGSPVATPARTSLAAAERAAPPPAAVRTRETVAVNTPPAPRAAIREGREDARNARAAGNDERPRVRVVNRGERVNLQQAAGAPATPAAPATQAAPAPQAKSAETQRAQPQPAPQPAPADRNARGQDKAASQPPASQQAERRAPAPPPEVSRRPTFDRDMRPSTAEERRGQRQERQAERQERREQTAAPRNEPAQPQAIPQRQAAPQLQAPQPQPAPQPQAAQRPAPDDRRAQQQEQQRQQRAEDQQRQQRAEDQQRQQRAEEQQTREQQGRQRDLQRQQQQEERQRGQQRSQQVEQQRQQQAEQNQAREQQARQQAEQRQNEERQRAQQQQREQQQAAREQQAQQRAQQQQAAAQQAAREQQAQQRAQQQQAQQQAQQRAQQQQAQQRAQQQQAQQQAQQRAQQQQAQQQAQQRAQQQQAQQRAQQQQAQQQAQQRAQQQQAQQQAQQRAQQQAQQQAQQRAQQQQAQQAAKEPARQQRAEGGREKGRERQRADEKG